MLIPSQASRCKDQLALNSRKYTKTYHSAKDTDSLILYSTKNAATILVPSSLIEDIEKGGLSDEEKESLTELGFLVRS